MVTLTRTCANPACANPMGNVLPPTDFSKGRRTCKYCDGQRATEHRKKKWDKCHRILNRYLGKNCVVCGEVTDKLLRCHEKFGEPHKKLLDTSLEEVKANCKSGRFVRVCAGCHGKAHSVIDKGIVGWELIKFYIKEFLATDPPIENDAHLRAWQKFMREKIGVKQLPLPMEVESPQPTAKSEQPHVHRGVPVVVGSLVDESKTMLVYPDELDDEDGEPDTESICMNPTPNKVSPA